MASSQLPIATDPQWIGYLSHGQAEVESAPFVCRLVIQPMLNKTYQNKHRFVIVCGYGYGSKLGTPKLWMVNTKLDIHICGPLGLPFWPTSIYLYNYSSWIWMLRLGHYKIYLSGWWLTYPSEKIWVNGKDDIPYMTWKITNVWNHQPVIVNGFEWSVWDIITYYNNHH